ncbi:hypothetical protein QP166_00445 [Sphingomonas sp. LR60]|uniref:hypothetical protein n=1 Tax=Sphingomonas sp. LR60 TaxID=3050233 RepID=UPI002FDF8F9B
MSVPREVTGLGRAHPMARSISAITAYSRVARDLIVRPDRAVQLMNGRGDDIRLGHGQAFAQKRGRMSLYLRLRRFVDRDLSRRSVYGRSTTFSPLGVIVPLAPCAFLDKPYGFAELVIAAVSAAVAVIWIAFLLWRASRLLRAVGARGDRDFDRHSKYILGPEYRSTESYTAARLRKRRNGN